MTSQLRRDSDRCGKADDKRDRQRPRLPPPKLRCHPYRSQTGERAAAVPTPDRQRCGGDTTCQGPIEAMKQMITDLKPEQIDLEQRGGGGEDGTSPIDFIVSDSDQVTIEDIEAAVKN